MVNYGYWSNTTERTAYQVKINKCIDKLLWNIKLCIQINLPGILNQKTMEHSHQTQLESIHYNQASGPSHSSAEVPAVELAGTADGAYSLV